MLTLALLRVSSGWGFLAGGVTQVAATAPIGTTSAGDKEQLYIGLLSTFAAISVAMIAAGATLISSRRNNNVNGSASVILSQANTIADQAHEIESLKTRILTLETELGKKRMQQGKPRRPPHARR